MAAKYKTPHFTKPSAYGDATIYIVGGYEEAMTLAKEMRDAEDFDIFRGHASWNFKPDPTLARKVREKGNDYLTSTEYFELINYFSQFVTNHPSGKYLRDNNDAFYAIAQHYGLPTSYLDFTTDPEVAGFFAIYNRSPAFKDDLCEIICVNRGHFNEKIKHFAPEFKDHPGRLPRIVEIDVTNLWRLHIQKGLFINMPLLRYANKEKIESFEEHFFSLDRIQFLHSERIASTLSPDRVYPKDKSLLEEIIDQYFDNKRRKDWMEEVREKKGSGEWDVMIMDDVDVAAQNIFLGDPGIDPSWENVDLESDLSEVDEHWEEMDTGEVIVIHIDCNTGRVESERGIFEQISTRLNGLKNDIKYLLRFEIEVVNCAKPDLFKKELSHCLSRIWNGMRLRSYSRQEIARSLTNYLVLEYAAYTHYVVEKMGGDEDFFYRQPVKLVLAGPNSAETRSYVEQDDFREAFRDGFHGLLRPEYLKTFISGDFRYIGLNQSDPRCLYDFNRLRTLFIEQIIPGQIYRRGIEEKYPIFFSPGQVSVVGEA